MKLGYLAAVGLLVLACQGYGCACATVSKQMPDGSRVSATVFRSFWKTQAFKLRVKTAEGSEIDCTLGISQTDAESVKAGAEGLGKGIAKGIVPSL